MLLDDLLSRNQPLPARPISESYWVIPGRYLAGEYPGTSINGKTSTQLDAFLEAGFDTFIDLTSPEEMRAYDVLLYEQAGYYGKQVEYLRFPISDFGLPSHWLMKKILDAIDFALAGDRKIYLHCHGGIGRTGTAVGCFLVRHGRSGYEAVAELANWWSGVPKSAQHPHSPETSQQREFILDWPGD